MADNTNLSNNVIQYHIDLNRNPDVQPQLQVFKVKQYDTGRSLYIHLFEGSTETRDEWNAYITTGTISSFHLRLRKPDGKVWMQKCKILDTLDKETVVYVKLDGQALMSPGRAYADLLEIRTYIPNKDEESQGQEQQLQQDSYTKTVEFKATGVAIVDDSVESPPLTFTDASGTYEIKSTDNRIIYDISTTPFILDIVPSPNVHPEKQFSSDAFPYLLEYLHSAKLAESYIENLQASASAVSVDQDATATLIHDEETNVSTIHFEIPCQSKPSVSDNGTLVWPNVTGGSCNCELEATSSGDRLTLDIAHGE